MKKNSASKSATVRKSPAESRATNVASPQLLGMAELLRSSWQSVTGRFGALLGISVLNMLLQISLVVVAIMIALATGAAQAISAYNKGVALQDLLTTQLVQSVGLVFVTLIVVLMVESLLAQMTMLRVLFNHKESVMDAFRRSVHKFWPMLGASMLVGFMTIGSFWLLVIPGFVFSLWFMFALYEIALFDTAVTVALNRSAAVTRRHFWGIFGRFALMLFFTMIVSSLFDETAASASGSLQPVVGLASILFQFLISWMWMAFMGKLYLGVRDERTTTQSLTIPLVIAGLGWAVFVFFASSIFSEARAELPNLSSIISKIEGAIQMEQQGNRPGMVQWDTTENTTETPFPEELLD